MIGSTLATLWPEVDRVALCVHRPAGADPELREVFQRLQIPAGSVVVSAARHVAAGHVSMEQLELVSRYESRALVQLNAQRHIDLGFFEQAGEGEFVPNEPFRAAARVVLDVQARAAQQLWEQVVDLAALAALADTAVAHAAEAVPVPAPAFRAQLSDHNVTPSGAAGQLLASVTELRYLRSDLHAHALANHELAGPTARAVDRLWKEHPVSDDDLERLARKGLVEKRGEGMPLTDAARHAREHAQAETDGLSVAAFAGLSVEQLAALHDGLTRLPGEDPRPLEDR